METHQHFIGGVQEEMSGPVLVAIRARDKEGALRIVNVTGRGLAAGVWSGDLGRAMRLSRQVRLGQGSVDDYGAGGGMELPSGGVKRSGYWREKEFEALYGSGARTMIAIKHGG